MWNASCNYIHKYVAVIAHNTYSFKDITNEDLIEIGITKLGHRKVIMKAIKLNADLLAPI